MANFTVGLDLGQARDYSALVVTERVQVVCPVPAEWESFEEPTLPDDAYTCEGRDVHDEFHVRHVQRWSLGTPYPVIVDQVAELMQTPDFDGVAQLVLDATGVGAAVADMFTEAYKAGRLGELWPKRITLTGGFSSDLARRRGSRTAHKGDVVARLLSLFERRRLVMPPGLPQADALERELRAFTLKQSKAGRLTFEAKKESDHDDLVIALALSVWIVHRRGEPRYVTPNGELREKL